MSPNQAAWSLASKAKPLVVQDAPMPKPGPMQVVIQSKVIALNPVEWKVQDFDFFHNKYPLIMGADVGGLIEEVGEGISHLHKGQRVIGYCMVLGVNDARFGAYQRYPLVYETLVSPVPEHMSLTQAVVLPLAITTAAVSLYHPNHLAFPLPQKDPIRTGKTILIWGGASSVGATAVQLAVASGFKVVATASKRNHDLVYSLGASLVLDYKSETIVDDAVAALEDYDLAGCYDAISEPQTLEPLGAILDQLGPHKVCLVVPPTKEVSHNMKWTFSMTFEIMDDKGKPVGDYIWHKYVPEALADGRLHPKPDPLVISRGIETIQDGLNRLKKGVSAQKLIVEV
ncbi:chaperonin 10-like protein [Fusarium oxysporum Fo47]|nr:chaperonin 10-like protein [Fusarium oxysporum Fo47]KAH7208331.1 chaperonin 10-like protein [Fusarium oxysporum]QKD46475.2 chaperonin 10-like protein [Fusarium oxysporum Fo47]